MQFCKKLVIKWFLWVSKNVEGANPARDCDATQQQDENGPSEEVIALWFQVRFSARACDLSGSRGTFQTSCRNRSSE